MKVIGIALIVLGIFGLAYGGISWTHQKKVLDVGPVELNTTKRETVPLPPIAGGVCLVLGVALVMTNGKRL